MAQGRGVTFTPGPEGPATHGTHSNLHRNPAGRWGGDHELASSLGRPLATEPARSEQANSRRRGEPGRSVLQTSSQAERKKSVLISCISYPSCSSSHHQPPESIQATQCYHRCIFPFVFCFFLVTNIATFEHKIAWRQRDILILFFEYIFLSFAAPKA